MSQPAFPATRLRRSRSAAWSRALVAETVLTPSDLIWPLFIAEGQGVEEPIPTLPGVSRWSVDFIAEIPRNPTGKMLKKDLRAPFWEGRERNVN